jgi:hypothetical protein
VISFPDILCLRSRDVNYGQANRFSRMERRVTAGRSSIITRLASRSITCYDPPIQVHRHCDLDLHLVWEFDNNGVPSEACMRRGFFFYDDIARFCQQLILGGSRGLYSCTTDTSDGSLSDNVEMCFRILRVQPEKGSPLYDCTCCCKKSPPTIWVDWPPPTFTQYGYSSSLPPS